jgi:hypothetical protein
MKRLLPVVVSTLILGLNGPAARAQNVYPYMAPQYGPGYQTQLSPYLNFLRGGDPAANYFLGVLPEFQRRENANQFRSQIQNLQIRTAPIQSIEEIIASRQNPKKLLPSGHPTAFGPNYAGYFNTPGPVPARAAMSGRPAQPGPTGR